MRATLTFVLTLLTFACAFSQTARVQIIHNSPSPNVDIYANGDKLLNNFVFRTATPFIDVPANVGIDIAVAAAGSNSAADAIANFPVQFDAGKTYVVVAAGVVGGAEPFNLFVYDMGQETAAGNNVGILFFHGSPDAPEVDITTGGAVLFNDVAFGDFAGYLEVPAASYDLNVTPANDNSVVVASYQADLSFWRGRTAVVFASGFLSGANPAFEPWVALDNGGTFPLKPIPTVDSKAKVQIIHNSPDPAATAVDIYVNDDLLLDNFGFREATPYVEVPMGVVLNIGVAPANSTSSADAIAVFPVTFEAGKRYIVVADGVLTIPGPAFNLEVFDMGREKALSPGNFDLAIHHGSPDAPAVDIAARGVGLLQTDLVYPAFRDYLSLAPTTYYIDVKPAGTSTIVETFEVNVGALAGRTGIAIASGLVFNDPPFTLIVVLDDGTVVQFPTAKVARMQVIHNSPTPTVDLWVNGDKFLGNFAFRTATPYVTVPAGTDLTIGVALANSTSASDALVNFTVNLENGKTYVVVANGIVGGTPGFGLDIFDMGEERADAPNNVGVLFFHGSPDAPAVDILADGGLLFNDVSFGGFAGYANVPAGSYEIAVTPANDNNTIVAAYDADLSFWRGRTAVIFASGFLGGANPAFEPWVALDNGGTFPLKPASHNLSGGNAQAFMQSPGNSMQVASMEMALLPNPATDWLNVKVAATEGCGKSRLSVVNLSGQLLLVRDLGENDSEQTINFDLTGLQSGTYFMRYEKGNQVQTAAFQVAR